MQCRAASSANQREQRRGDEHAEQVEQRRCHHRTRQIAARQRAVGCGRLHCRRQAAEIEKPQRDQGRHPALPGLPKGPPRQCHAAKAPQRQRQQQPVITEARHHFMPGQPHAVEEEQQKHRSIGDKLRHFARAAGYGQDQRQRDCQHQQAHHRVDAG